MRINIQLLLGCLSLFNLIFPLSLTLAQTVNPSSTMTVQTKDLNGTSWQLIGWSQLDSPIPLIQGTTLTLDFSQDSLSGSGGCNRYHAGYQRKDDQLTITPVASTRMACPEDIMQQESQYFEHLNNAQTYRFNEEGQLEIQTTKGILFFESQTALNDATSWLEQETPQNWNQAGLTIPTAPNEGEGSNLEACQEQIRKPSTPEDQAILEAGWTLFGPIQVYGKTSVHTAMSNTDGMCRPMGYQQFVFVAGQFAGTLSPIPMFSRRDGSSVNVYLADENRITTEFNRYTEQDALCCPSGRSYVSYTIENQQGQPLVIPQEINTQP